MHAMIFLWRIIFIFKFIHMRVSIHTRFIMLIIMLLAIGAVDISMLKVIHSSISFLFYLQPLRTTRKPLECEFGGKKGHIYQGRVFKRSAVDLLKSSNSTKI